MWSVWGHELCVWSRVQVRLELPSRSEVAEGREGDWGGYLALLCHPAGVESIPVLAALQSSSGLHSLLSGLCQELQVPHVRRWSSFFAAGLEQDDFQEALEELRTLSQCYETGFGADGSEDEADSD